MGFIASAASEKANPKKIVWDERLLRGDYYDARGKAKLPYATSSTDPTAPVSPLTPPEADSTLQLPLEKTSPTTADKKSMVDVANAAYAAKQYARAAYYYTRCYKTVPDSPYAAQAMRIAAVCHYLDKNYDQTVLTVNQLVENYPNEGSIPLSLLVRAYSEYELGQFRGARSTLRGIRLSYPEFQPDKVNAFLNKIR